MNDFHELKHQVDKHEKFIVGDMFANPPVPGMQQVLAKMYDTLCDPEKGNVALHRRTSALELEDTKRVAWAGGAKWVIGGLVGLIAFLIGLYFGK